VGVVNASSGAVLLVGLATGSVAWLQPVIIKMHTPQIMDMVGCLSFIVMIILATGESGDGPIWPFEWLPGVLQTAA
jgi:hypothetical protein